jgi:nucleotide-binding universal stress UspA family protein
MVHLQLGCSNAALLSIAGDLADRLGACVIGVAVCQPMRIIYSDGYIPAEIIDQDRQQIDADMKAAHAAFRATLGDRIPASEWRPAITYLPLAEQLAKEARCADLVITAVDQKLSMFDTARHVEVGDLVMQLGRPCLVVPAGVERLALNHVVIGWKDSGETRRAVSDALPLLRLAGRVTVIEIAAEDDLDDASGRVKDVAFWLNRHGIAAAALTAASTGDDAGHLDAIMQEQRADLIVAGAYGHSRLREWVLGGVTRDLLLKAKRCALVAH